MNLATLHLGQDVHYADSGEGDRPIVLLHGLGGSHANWLAVADRLAARTGRRVLAPDLAGFGKTPLVDTRASVPHQIKLLRRFVDHVSPRAPVTLVGNSMGGMISLFEAAARPDRVDALVLVGAAMPRPPEVPLDREVLLQFAAFVVPFVGTRFLAWRNARMTAEQSVRETMRVCCVDARRIPPDVFARQVEVARARRGYRWANDAFIDGARSVVFELSRRRAYFQKMRAVRASTLLVHGVEDRLVPVAASRLAARLRSDWSLVELDDVGHVPQLEAPERFVDAVAGWLEKLGDARAA